MQAYVTILLIRAHSLFPSQGEDFSDEEEEGNGAGPSTTKKPASIIPQADGDAKEKGKGAAEPTKKAATSLAAPAAGQAPAAAAKRPAAATAPAAAPAPAPVAQPAPALTPTQVRIQQESLDPQKSVLGRLIVLKAFLPAFRDSLMF